MATDAVALPVARAASWRQAIKPWTGGLSLLGGAILWEAAGRGLEWDFLPPLSVVLQRLVDLTRDGEILGNLATSLQELGLGLGISVVVGLAIGLLMGVYPKVDAAIDIYIYAFLTAPSLALAPIFFALFGTGPQTIIAVVIMYSIFIIIVDTSQAVQEVPRSLLEMSRSFGASEVQLLRTVVIPAAVPLMMAGIRAGASRAVKGMINGEMFIAVVGLGAVMMNAGDQFDAPQVFAVLMVVIVLALVLNSALVWLDARLTRWMPATSRTEGATGPQKVG